MANMTAPLPIPEARVLVVDDEAHVRSALARSLTLLGYRADEAASGHQALGMLERTPTTRWCWTYVCQAWMASRLCSGPIRCIPT